MSIPLWRRRQLREKEAAREERGQARVNNLFDLSGEFDEVDGILVPKPTTLAYWSPESGTVCRDCRAQAGPKPLPVVLHATNLCAHCGRQLVLAGPLPTKPMTRRRKL